MSYDLMVFNTKVAPKTRMDFMNWYREQTSWKEKHGYNNPEVTTVEMKNFLREIVKFFPAMNAPYAKDEKMEADRMADYTIGADIIYITFPWLYSDLAYEITKKLANKHLVGFFDVSADDGEIIFTE